MAVVTFVTDAFAIRKILDHARVSRDIEAALQDEHAEIMDVVVHLEPAPVP